MNAQLPKVLLLSSIFQSLVTVAVGGAVLKLWMVTYDNSNEKDWHNNCCDLMCIGQCDHRFTFCLDRYNGNNKFDSCAYRREQSGELRNQNVNHFGSDISGVRNPIVINFNSWERAKLKIGVWDDDDFNNHDKVDELFQNLAINPDASSTRAIYREMKVTGRRPSLPSELTMRVMLYCEEDYYGSKCSTYCKARDDNFGHYRCDPDTGAIVCLSGWEDTSKQCTVVKDNCVGVTCLNHGYCEDRYNSFTCSCLPGFTGRFCEVNINECASNPCKNGGVCIDEVNGYMCNCSAGYVGLTCAGHVCDVASPCKNGGTCYDAGNCSCPTGYVGSTCDIHRCDVNTCHNGGTCLHDGSCQCPLGYVGSHCDLDPCQTFVKCDNSGTCDKGLCVCPAGFTGRYCQTMIDNCVGDPCLNEGVCLSDIEGYTCKCLPDFNGTHCESTLDPLYDKQVWENSTYPTNMDVPTIKHEGLEPWAIGLIILVLILVIVICVVVSILWMYRRRAKRAQAEVEGPGFENPAYSSASPVSLGQLNTVTTPNHYHTEGDTLHHGITATVTEQDPKDHVYDNPFLLRASASADSGSRTGGEYAAVPAPRPVPPPLPVRNQSVTSETRLPDVQDEEEAPELPIKEIWPPTTDTYASGVPACPQSPVPVELGGDYGYAPMGSPHTNC